MASGCTLGAEEPLITETPASQNIHQQTTVGTFSPDNSSIKVSWPQDENPVPPYSEEEKVQIVEEAKQEIIRLFPYVEKNTLDNFSWGSQFYGGYRAPAIVFSDVLESSDSDQRILNIKYDPDRSTICTYVPDVTNFYPDDELVVSVEEAEERVLEFYKNAVGDDYEIHKDDLIVIRDDGETLNSVFLNMEVYTTYKGVVYNYDHARIVTKEIPKSCPGSLHCHRLRISLLMKQKRYLKQN